MRKRLFLNGFLALVVIGAAVGTYFTVHSTSSSASTTQTLATAKRGVVLSSVTSTGNVEAPTDLSLVVPAVGPGHRDLGVGRRARQCRPGARPGSTTPRRRWRSRRRRPGSCRRRRASRRWSAARPRSSGRPTRCRSYRRSRTSRQRAAGAHRRAAERGEQRHQVRLGDRPGAAGAHVGERRGDVGAERRVPERERAREPPGHGRLRTFRRRACSTRCRPRATNSHRLTAGLHRPSGFDYNGVTCSQVSNLSTFVKNVQSAQSSLSQAQAGVTQAQDGVTSAQQAKTSGEMQDQQQIQNAQGQLTSAQTQYQSTLVNNAVKEEPPKPEQLAQAQASIVSAQAQLQTAQKNESETTLTAPGRGRGRVDQRPGRPAVGERRRLVVRELRVVFGVFVVRRLPPRHRRRAPASSSSPT